MVPELESRNGTFIAGKVEPFIQMASNDQSMEYYNYGNNGQGGDMGINPESRSESIVSNFNNQIAPPAAEIEKVQKIEPKDLNPV